MDSKEKNFAKQESPLAVRMRPRFLKEVIGQDQILGKGKILRRALESGRIPPLIFYGPAGCGKTTLGFIVSDLVQGEFHYLNAAFSSVKEVKEILVRAREVLRKEKKQTVLFIDEVHRFNKLQQEALVPDTEQGTIIFVAATIYKPNYYLIPSIMSRSIIAGFKPLSTKDIMQLMKRAVCDKERGLGRISLKLTNKALEYIAVNASGDGRKALASLELGALSTEPDKQGNIIINLEVAVNIIQKNLAYDRKDSYHYDTISAFIKSVRGSDPDSALYWLAKMLNSGEDPRFIARRLVILASEDIGNADPFCLVLATSCFKSVEFVGMPESSLILAQTTIYLSAAPKSNSSCTAIGLAMQDVDNEETREVPEHIKTCSSQYLYPHSFGGYVDQDYGAVKQYYFPENVGKEKRIKQFLAEIRSEK